MGLFRGDFYSPMLSPATKVFSRLWFRRNQVPQMAGSLTTGVQVIFPENSNDVTPVISGTPRVLYLLHGLSGSCVEWTRFLTEGLIGPVEEVLGAAELDQPGTVQVPCLPPQNFQKGVFCYEL